jgi:hypothetical protein
MMTTTVQPYRHADENGAQLARRAIGGALLVLRATLAAVALTLALAVPFVVLVTLALLSAGA